MIIKSALLLLLALRTDVFALPSYTIESGVRITSGAVQHVQSITGGYRMYYSSAGYFVKSATSTDGVSWNDEGVILATSTTLGALDSSSITAFGMYYNSSLSYPYRAYYVGVNVSGYYSVLSAKSDNATTWTKDTSFSTIQFGSGAGYVTSPRPYKMSNGNVMLYYVRDSTGGNSRGTYRIYRMTSSNGGTSFSSETELLPSTTAYYIDISTLTDSRIRMHITSPLSGQATGSQVLSAISSNDGQSFTIESGVRFSTPSATSEIYNLALARSTDTFNWRMYMGIALSSPTTTYTYSAITTDPSLTRISPTGLYNSASTTTITIYGEIFSTTTPTVAFGSGGNSLPVSSVTRDSDVQLSANVNPYGASLGNYTLTVTNANGAYVNLSNALNIDYQAGSVILTDNLFKPLRGGQCKIDVLSYAPGNMTINIYTTNGEKVKNLYNGVVAIGTTTIYWDGKTNAGNVVASGLYYMEIKAPKINKIEKVVVIK